MEDQSPHRGTPLAHRLLVDGTDVAAVVVADGYLSRLVGLIGRRRLPEALLLDPASSVHGWGILRSLDVALLGADDVVRHVLHLRPGGVTRPRRGVRRVLEAPAGSFTRWSLRAGSHVQVVPATGSAGGQ